MNTAAAVTTTTAAAVTATTAAAVTTTNVATGYGCSHRIGN